MSDTLYPHEVIIKSCMEILKQPNTLSDSIGWLLFAYAIMLIQEFVFYGMVVINESKMTNIICIGLETCINLTLILLIFGLIGFAQSLSRGK